MLASGMEGVLILAGRMDRKELGERQIGDGKWHWPVCNCWLVVAVWRHRADDVCWHHGPRGGSPEEGRRKGGVLFKSYHTLCRSITYL